MRALDETPDQVRGAFQLLLTQLSHAWAMEYVYILASRPGGALYIGRTSNLLVRVEQHRSGRGSVHTARYKIRTLVWYEGFEDWKDAAACERRMKRWKRSWKDQLIAKSNPSWKDLSAQMIVI